MEKTEDKAQKKHNWHEQHIHLKKDNNYLEKDNKLNMSNNMSKKTFYGELFFLLAIALVIVSVYNTIQLSSLSTLAEDKIIEAKQAAILPKIELAVININFDSCKDCFDILPIVENIESYGVNVTSKKELIFSEDEAKQLIEKYGIEKLPTVIVTGETEKSSGVNSNLKQLGELKDGAYIFTKHIPPFIDASTGQVKGIVSIISLKKKDCKDCFDIDALITQLLTLGIKSKEKQDVYIDSIKGKELIKKYNITNVPALIIDSELKEYPSIIEVWKKLGSVEDDGSYVMRETLPPYYNIEEGKIKGLVLLTIIGDKSCSTCYNPETFHKPILQSIGVTFSEENTVDISSKEGKTLVDKYKITKVPTIILNGDVDTYPVLVKAWKSVGTVESDNTYVFRQVEVAQQPYKDLTTNKIIEPTTTSAGSVS